ncbi:MAG: hypothetical protein ACERK6_00280 [Candidatus Aminicenantaceae bacterium]
MEKRRLAVFLVLVLGICLPALAQFNPEELEKRPEWEGFLVNAESIDQSRMNTGQAVTNPWILTLSHNGVTNKAIWKNPSGRMKGYLENWRWEIAAYKLDKLLGLNMVPPTVERDFGGDRGSAQLWIEGCFTLRDKVEDDIKTPSYKVFQFNRAYYLQRAFDNLIANEDRHQNQYLITEDFRMLLIDHSRSFRTSGKFTKGLIFTKKNGKEMKQLPAAFIEKLRALDFAMIKEAVGEYLNEKEINAVLKRRDLILKAVDKRIEELGEEKVLY